MTLLETFHSLALEKSPLDAAELLVEHFRRNQEYPELFELLKMRNRIQLGLPAVAVEGSPPLTGEVNDKIEHGLIEACREVGLGLLKKGRLQEGWMYMRPVGDTLAAREAIADHTITSENLDMYLNILIHEGVDISRGVREMLKIRGTCNTITLLESVIAMRDRKDQQAGVAPLIRHVHQELLDNVLGDLQRREGKAFEFEATEEASITRPLQSILRARPDFLRDGSYHLDTSHLSSTVRFARVLDGPADLALALDLARYGRELHKQHQYPSEEPFADLYAMSTYFFSALLGENTEANLRPFLQKAESLDIDQHGTVGVETYVDLLSRIGRHQEALDFLVKRMPRGVRPFGIAPSLIDLSAMANNFQPMLQQSKERGDLIGYAAALLQERTTGKT
jgi:hypothetical protein